MSYRRRSRSRSPRRRRRSHSPPRRRSEHHRRDHSKSPPRRRRSEHDRESRKRSPVDVRGSRSEHEREKGHSPRSRKEDDKRKDDRSERHRNGSESHSPRRRGVREEKPEAKGQAGTGERDMEVEEAGGQENQRTDRFRNERFDNANTTEAMEGHHQQSRENTRRWGDWKDTGNEPRERDFNRGRGRGNFRGRREPPPIAKTERLMEALTDPTDVPRVGNFFEHDDREAPQWRRRPMPPRNMDPREEDARRPPRRYSSDERYRMERDKESGRGRRERDEKEEDWKRRRERDVERDRGERDRGEREEWKGRREREIERERGERRDDRGRRDWREGREGWRGRGRGGRVRSRSWRGGSPDLWKHDLFEELEKSPVEQEDEEKETTQRWRSVVQPVSNIETKWTHDKFETHEAAMDTGL